ncbi:hypothetical protein ACS0TY_033714 [Phlomoides rotata]
MARIYRRKTEVLLVVEEIILEIVFMLSVIINRYRNTSQFRGLNVENVRRYRMADRISQQIEYMSELVGMSDTDCFDNLRLNREAFNRLCYLLRHMWGLVDGRYVTVGEQVALFLSVLSHHSKVRVVRFRFKRSGQTIHTYFHYMLRAVLKLHEVLLAKPSPVTDDSTHPSSKHFKKQTKQGSAADLRVLRDAIARDDGLRVPHELENCLRGLTELEDDTDDSIKIGFSGPPGITVFSSVLNIVFSAPNDHHRSRNTFEHFHTP